MGRIKEFNDLFGKKLTTENYTWHLHSEVYPNLFRMKAEGKIKDPVKTAFSDMATWGGTDVMIDGMQLNY